MNIIDRSMIYKMLEEIPSDKNKFYWVISSSRNPKIKSNHNNKMCGKVKPRKLLGYWNSNYLKATCHICILG